MVVLVILCCIIIVAIVIAALKFDKDLTEFEPITDEELLLLQLVDEKYYADLLTYVRTFSISIEFQDYIANKKDALKAISYYICIQAAKKEKEKREKWEKENLIVEQRPIDENRLSHQDKMILASIKRFQKSQD
jgi:hypothetical protein